MKNKIYATTLIMLFIVNSVFAQNNFGQKDSIRYSQIGIAGGLQLKNEKVKDINPLAGLLVEVPLSYNWSLPFEVFLWNIFDHQGHERRWVGRLAISAKYKTNYDFPLNLYLQSGAGIASYLYPPIFSIHYGIGLEYRVTPSYTINSDARVLSGIADGGGKILTTPLIITFGIKFSQ
ncbi:MAG: hypothetical protein NTX22_02135 [Ignavibacteriales bacterium]|nr:hypothetical protein [Ignavibacteriales bacterium]